MIYKKKIKRAGLEKEGVKAIAPETPQGDDLKNER